MVVTEDASLVLVVAILRTENCWANRARKMLNVVFPVQCCDVGATKSIVAGVTNQIESLEVIFLAKWILVWTLVGDWEELGGNYLATFL